MPDNAVRDQDGNMYHMKCAPDLEDLEETVVNGYLCFACGDVITDDDDNATTLDDEEEEA